MVEVVRPWLVDARTAYLAEVRAVSPYLGEDVTLTRVAGFVGLYGFGDGIHKLPHCSAIARAMPGNVLLLMVLLSSFVLAFNKAS